MWSLALQWMGFVALALSLAAHEVLRWRSSDGMASPGSIAAPVVMPGATGELPQFSLVVAGRDVKYCQPGYGPGKIRAVPCTGPDRLSDRTDTLLYVRVSPVRTEVLSIPRDTLVEHDGIYHKVNTSYRYGGPLGIKTAVEQLVGERVDYYAIVNIEFAEAMIDAMGGVEVYIPEAMKYDDYAGGLHIDIPQGNQVLRGDDAIGYLRIRKGYGDDYARMDRAKVVMGKLLEKAKTPAVLAAIPTLLQRISSDIETNMDTNLIQGLLPHVRSVKPRFGTLPTQEPSANERFRLSGLGDFLVPNRDAISTVLTDDGANPTPQVPGGTDVWEQRNNLAPIVIINGTGVPGVARAMAKQLELAGFPSPTVVSGPASDDATQLMRQPRGDLASAEAYGEFLGGLAVFSPHFYQDLPGPVVLHLGRNALNRYGGLREEAAAILQADGVDEEDPKIEEDQPLR
jgi:polyisoprenyl-teichoic acid--peptidoglycan teichoic acid transferase